MKRFYVLFAITVSVLFIMCFSCESKSEGENRSAIEEQRKTEVNQSNLNKLQPPPKLSWSLERDN